MNIEPSHPLIAYLDCHSIVTTDTGIQFSRPQFNHVGLSKIQPGARMAFRTAAREIRVNLRHTAQSPADYVYNGHGAVLVDGTLQQTFSCGEAWNEPQTFSVAITHDTAAPRTHHIVMPYGTSVAVMGLSLPADEPLMPLPALKRPRYVAYGDSITQGFNATDVTKTWAFRLADANTWEVINLGVAALRLDAAQGVEIAALQPDVITMLLGYNDYIDQRPMVEFKAQFETLLRTITTQSPRSMLYVITPTWSSRGRDHPMALEYFRLFQRLAVSHLALKNVVLVEGEALAANDRESFVDGVHPSDKGHAEIFKSLSKIIRLQA